MRSVFLFIAAGSALLAVAMGAFGAHALKHTLNAEMMTVYKTAVSYQMWHSLGLGVIALCRMHLGQGDDLLDWAGWFMAAGILLFSGSLYLLVLLNMKWLGMITPLGGVAWILAWFLLCLHAAGVGATGARS